MSLDTFYHALGCASLAAIGGAGALAAHSLLADVQPQWRRILRLAAGHIEPPAASGAPHAPACLPSCRGVEAAAAPTFSREPRP